MGEFFWALDDMVGQQRQATGSNASNNLAFMGVSS